MHTYVVTLTGTMPIIMHADDIPWADRMEAWKNDPEVKKNKQSKPGDDRTPAWRWLGHAYQDGTRFVVPTDNIATCSREGGTMVPVPGGRSGKTFKAQSQSGIYAPEGYWPLLVGEQEIPWAPFAALMQQENFDRHQDLAAQYGFMLFVKRVRIGKNKHIRVRPRFDTWKTRGLLRVTDEQITKGILLQILSYAGAYKGLADWRPSSPTPGRWGTFTAVIEDAAAAAGRAAA